MLCDVRLGIMSGFQGEAWLVLQEQAQNFDKIISLGDAWSRCLWCLNIQVHQQRDQGITRNLYVVSPRGKLTVCRGSGGYIASPASAPASSRKCRA